MLLLHESLRHSNVTDPLDEISVVVQVREDFKKEFKRELENYGTQVMRGEPKHMGQSLKAHFRWSGIVRGVGFLKISVGLKP
jgi:hypothetical protein